MSNLSIIIYEGIVVGFSLSASRVFSFGVLEAQSHDNVPGSDYQKQHSVPTAERRLLGRKIREQLHQQPGNKIKTHPYQVRRLVVTEGPKSQIVSVREP